MGPPSALGSFRGETCGQHTRPISHARGVSGHDPQQRKGVARMTEKLPSPHDASGAIVRVRGQAVILDSALAKLYGVTTSQLNQQVKRNQKRFPKDFVFQLSMAEYRRLRSQNVTLKRGQHRKYAPYAFTEHGAIQAANVLRSEQAEQMGVAVVRAFVRLRRMALSVEGLACKLNALESRYDKQFKVVFDAVRSLMAAPPGNHIEGFSSKEA